MKKPRALAWQATALTTTLRSAPVSDANLAWFEELTLTQDYSAGINFSRQNLTSDSVDPRAPSAKGLVM